MKKVLLCSVFLILAFGAFAQKNSANVGKKVGPVEIRDASDKPMMLPKLGEKNLLIFYTDPDHAGQNTEFREYLEKHQINSSNIFAFGVVNLKDAPLVPNSVARSMIRKKAEETKSNIYTDPDHLLRDAWNLGDCNNKFMIIFVNKNKVIEFCRWGDFNEADKKAFWEVINKYK